ncbi:MAG TPA: response regulator [Gemmatimonadales bacterium]
MESKKRILLVDDELIITRTLQTFLEGTGKFEVRAENNPKKALKAARDFQPDLILLDVIMPDLDGGEVAELLRADSALKDTPIVFLTSLVSRGEVVDSGGDIGGFPFIAKPIDPKTVLGVIWSALG